MFATRACYTIVFVGDGGCATYMHVWSTENGAQEISKCFFPEDGTVKIVFNELGSNHEAGHNHHFAPRAFRVYNGFIEDREELKRLAESIIKI